jgi:hypothetical protein
MQPNMYWCINFPIPIYRLKMNTYYYVFYDLTIELKFGRLKSLVIINRNNDFVLFIF